jgi:hypothetical protein
MIAAMVLSSDSSTSSISHSLWSNSLIFPPVIVNALPSFSLPCLPAAAEITRLANQIHKNKDPQLPSLRHAPPRPRSLLVMMKYQHTKAAALLLKLLVSHFTCPHCVYLPI